MNHSLDARGLRRALSAVTVAAGALLLVAPVAGASEGRPPAAASHGQAQADARPDQAGAHPDQAGARPEQAEARPDQAEPRPDQPAPPSNGAADPESPGASGEHKQTICHRTRSATNPYVQITIDFHAVDGELVEAESDHAERHDGPVFDAATMTSGDAWGDIIPPFDTAWGSFDGQNWPEGQAIFDAGCTVPVAETEVAGDEADDVTPTDDTPTEVAGDVVSNVVPTPASPEVEIVRAGATSFGQTEVMGTAITRNPAGARTEVLGAQVSRLARTGAGTGLLAAAGAGLVGLGFLLVRGTRRAAVTD